MAVALVAGALERGWRIVRAERVGPGGGACWIWAEGAVEAGEPVAFYAVADLELAASPVSARLAVAADESYQLFVNGAWLGAGRRQAGGPAAIYQVAPYLVPGTNRVALELRSARGAGGALVALLDAGGIPLMVSDRRWRVLRAFDPALLDPALPLPAGAPPRIWSEPPTGRWRGIWPPEPRPVTLARGQRLSVLRPAAVRRAGIPGAGWRLSRPDRWLDLDPRRARLPRAARTIATTFDWGEPVLGVPVLDLEGTAADRPATTLIALAETEEELAEAPRRLVVMAPGAPTWTAERPYRFRYLEVLGLALDRPAVAVPVAPALAARLIPPELDPRGIFGLEPPPRGEGPADAVLERLVDGSG